ncbi:MAG TPA: S-(hydroxymethyl)glutathione synthase [Kaistia sp.]|nr:S-(hydroxymethyl)glutathione synthase [Kaistia sp.]
MSETVLLHPAIDDGITAGSESFAGGTLACLCTEKPVKVRIDGQVVHNHACGCTKCWKPAGAIFAIVAVAPTANVHVVENGDKLAIVDPDALILRHACKACGAHMHGPVERDHAFKGLTFVHTELSPDKGWQAPQFAAFVSSVIEGGVPPRSMDGIRARIREVGLEPYDCLSPALMDALATFTAKKTGTLRE